MKLIITIAAAFFWGCVVDSKDEKKSQVPGVVYLMEMIESDTNLAKLDTTCMRRSEWDTSLCRNLRIEVDSNGDVVHLDLSKMRLDSIPSEIFNMVNLYGLLLNNNYIKLVPPEIAKLTNLHVLNMASNRVDSISFEIMQLNNLHGISFVRNKMCPWPDSLASWIHGVNFTKHQDSTSTVGTGDQFCPEGI